MTDGLSQAMIFVVFVASSSWQKTSVISIANTNTSVASKKK